MRKTSTANYKRSDRVGELIQVELADIIFREIKDPRIGIVTITGVKMTDDLKLARIYFVQMGQDTCDPATMKGLEQARSFLKRELGKRLKIRHIPDLIFTPDESFAYGSRIEKLLAEIGEEHAAPDN